MGGDGMTETQKQKLLARIDAAWALSPERPIAIDEIDKATWRITYRHRETGAVTTFDFSKAELRRELRQQERNNDVGSRRTIQSKAKKTPEPPSEPVGVGEEKTSVVKVLCAGVDTLLLNVYAVNEDWQVLPGEVAPDLQQELAVLKQRAQDEEEDIPSRFVFNGTNLLMRAKGGDGFQWILHNVSLTLAVNRSSKMTLLAQARLSSEYLWTTGSLDMAISDVHLFLSDLFGESLMLQVSGLDLAADVAFLHFGQIHELKEWFVTRAQLDDQMPLAVTADDDGMVDGPDKIKRRWRRLTGLPFGARTGQVSVVLYDKFHEIKYRSPNKEWFHDLWLAMKDEQGEPVWDGSSPVWRVEVRFRRQALHEFKQVGVFHGIENAYDLSRRIPGLWAYAVGHVGGGDDGWPDGWLRYVVPSEDTNRARWPVHPDWEVIQGAFASWSSAPGTSANGLDLGPYVRKRKYAVNMRRMVAQIAGCVVTSEAWRLIGDDAGDADVDADLSDTFHFLYQQVVDYLKEKERDFASVVHKKRVVYSIGVEETESEAEI
jgi:hypothetical protein